MCCPVPCRRASGKRPDTLIKGRDGGCKSGQSVGPNFESNRKQIEKADLVGSANAVDVFVGDIEAPALVDTGSQVCTVANWFVERHFPGTEIQSLSHYLNIKDASGNALQYEGLVELDLQSKDTSGCSVVIPTPFLIVKDTRKTAGTAENPARLHKPLL